MQSFQFFRLHSVPSSCNDWTMKATQKAELRREEACAVCAVKDWLENRYEVYLFAEATSTTTWMKHFYGQENENLEDDDDVRAAAPEELAPSPPILAGSLLAKLTLAAISSKPTLSKVIVLSLLAIGAEP